MQLSFTKMQGLGNDFLVVDTTAEQLECSPELIRKLSDRRRGVGFDQALFIAAPSNPGANASYRIFNADGGEVEQCGNGARCIARYLQRSRGSNEWLMESPAGLVRARCLADGGVSVNMGIPIFAPAEIPFLASAEQDRYELLVDGQTLEIGAVSMGNPHAVIPVDDVLGAPVTQLGPILETHPSFPRGVNVGFMQVLDRGSLRLRVHERGVGETQACGTGACAAAVIAQRWGWVDKRVRVLLPGGELGISWEGPGQPVWMSGPAEFVYEGTITI